MLRSTAPPAGAPKVTASSTGSSALRKERSAGIHGGGLARLENVAGLRFRHRIGTPILLKKAMTGMLAEARRHGTNYIFGPAAGAETIIVV